MIKAINSRIVIYPKDVERITGMKPRTARKLLQDLKLKLGKRPDQFISIREFCNCSGLAEDEVKAFLNE